MPSYKLPIICLFVVISTLVAAVPPHDVPLKCQENEEYYSCYLYRCQRTCEQFKENAPCLPLAPGCNLPGCECIDGYYKNSSGKCIPQSECFFVITCNAAPPDEKPFVLGIPSNRTRPTEQPFECPEHENYHKCEKELCYKSCEHLIRPPACPSLDPDCFEPACLCEKDTLRNAQGQCVPVHQCP
ncbi:hypothetical protein PYW08_015815 [Mythimna loreyi]|uniref:Uncharacterized protein n=1 Tax=Mythimna loreyi TaxID=667449 RepID=A0ACC2QS26_9NEOP|nr:hypothetical protein PYW08_015815 [Mythimna loreyi]